jgi:hypothetical protein
MSIVAAVDVPVVIRNEAETMEEVAVGDWIAQSVVVADCIVVYPPKKVFPPNPKYGDMMIGPATAPTVCGTVLWFDTIPNETANATTAAIPITIRVFFILLE